MTIVKRHPHEKWVAFRVKMHKADITETELIHRFGDFLRNVLPQSELQNAPQHRPKPKRVPKSKS